MPWEVGRNISLEAAGEAGVARNKQQHFFTCSGTSRDVWYRLASSLSSRDVLQQRGLLDAQQLPRVGTGPLGTGFVSPRAGTSCWVRIYCSQLPWAAGQASHAAFQGIWPSQASPPRALLSVPVGPPAHSQPMDTAAAAGTAEAPSQPSPHLQETAGAGRILRLPGKSEQHQHRPRASVGRGLSQGRLGVCKVGLSPKFPRSHEEFIPQI